MGILDADAKIFHICVYIYIYIFQVVCGSAPWFLAWFWKQKLSLAAPEAALNGDINKHQHQEYQGIIWNSTWSHAHWRWVKNHLLIGKHIRVKPLESKLIGPSYFGIGNKNTCAPRGMAKNLPNCCSGRCCWVEDPHWWTPNLDPNSFHDGLLSMAGPPCLGFQLSSTLRKVSISWFRVNRRIASHCGSRWAVSSGSTQARGLQLCSPAIMKGFFEGRTLAGTNGLWIIGGGGAKRKNFECARGVIYSPLGVVAAGGSLWWWLAK